MNNDSKIFRSIVKGVGASLPKKIVTNKDLTMTVDTSEEWIEERTGIKERRKHLREKQHLHLALRRLRKPLIIRD